MAPDDSEPNDDEALDELLDIVERHVAGGQPLDILGLASATLAIVLHPEPPVDIARELIRDRVIEDVVLRYIDLATTDSLTYAAALAGLIADDTLRRSLRAALDGAEADIPGWLAELDHAQLEHTTVVRDLYDDDEWLLGGIHLADGSRFAFRVEIDHNADSAVANAMAMPTAVHEVVERLRSAASADEVAIVEVTPTDFWARYTEAVALADTMDEPPRTDTWPSCRPLIEWALRQAPTDRRVG
jgi:uncharacterized protein (DUF2267 family)